MADDQNGGWQLVGTEKAQDDKSNGWQLVGTEQSAPDDIAARALAEQGLPPAAGPSKPKPDLRQVAPLTGRDMPDHVEDAPGSFEGHPDNAGAYGELGPGKVVSGVARLAKSVTPGMIPIINDPAEAETGAAEVLEGAGVTAAPLGAASAIISPLTTALGLGVGYGASKGAGALARKAGASPEAERLAEDVGFLAPSALGTVAGLHGGIEVTPEGTRIGGKAFGGKVAGEVAVTPEQVGVGAKVGENVFQKIWPKGNPSEPELQAPTIKGEAGAVSSDPKPPLTPAGSLVEGQRLDEAVQAMAKKDAIDKLAGGIVTGAVPPPAPPQEPAGPPPGPNTEIKQESLDLAAKHLASLPEGQRGTALIQAHQTLAGALMHAGTVVGPDGKLYTFDKPEAASKTAMKWVNDTIGKRAKEQAETAKAKEAEVKQNDGWELVGAEAPKESIVGAQEEPVVAETKATLGKQMEALKAGNIHVVMVPEGQDAPSTPSGFAKIEVKKGPGSGTYLYNPQQYKASQIRRAAETGTHGAMLGHVQSKEELAGKPTVTVQATAKDGTPIQDSEVEAGNQTAIDAQKAVLQDRHPDASINVKTTDEVVGQRIAEGQSEQPLTGENSPKPVENSTRAVEKSEPQRAQLPSDLRGSKPRYGYKDKNFELKFANDTDRALYTIAQKVPNKAHDRFMTWLRSEFPGESDPAIFQKGKAIRESIKPLASEADPADGPLEVPTLALPPKKKEDETQTASPKAGSASSSEANTQSHGENPPKESQTQGPIAREAEKKVAPPEKEHKYKFGNTQANIHGNSEAADAMRLARARISDADLAPQKNDELGGELEPHVTVRYGIQGEDTSGIRDYLRKQAPFEASLGKTDAFPPSDHSEGAAPLIAPIESEHLHRINDELQRHGDFAPPSFPEYKPHATIAYVKADKASKYVGMDVTEGKKFRVTKIAITDRDGNQEIVPLEGDEQNTPANNNDEAVPTEQAENATPPVTTERTGSANEFKQWFGDSQVIDDKGRPKVVYHGTNVRFDKFEPRDTFRNIDGRPQRVQAQMYFFSEDKGVARVFANDKVEISKRLKGEKGGSPSVKPYYLKAENPFETTVTPTVTKQMLDDGYNDFYSHNELAINPYAAQELALIVGNEPEDGPTTWDELQEALDDPHVVAELKAQGFDSVHLLDNGTDTWAVFEPSQIRPVTPPPKKNTAEPVTNIYPGPLAIPKQEKLAVDERAVERKFATWVNDDLPRAIAAYRELPEAQGGRFIAADVAKQLSPEYQQNPGKYSYAVHNTSSHLAQAAFQQMLDEMPRGSDFYLVLGPPGAGKTTAFRQTDLHAPDEDAVAYEGSANSPEIIGRRIKAIVDKGHQPSVVFVYTSPEVAAARVADRAMGPEGRVVSSAYLANAYVVQPKVVAELVQSLKGKAEILIYKSVDGVPPENIDPETLDRIRYNGSTDELKQQLDREFQALNRSGRLDAATLERITGAASPSHGQSDQGIDAQGPGTEEGRETGTRTDSSSVEKSSPSETEDPTTFGMTVPGVPEVAEWTAKSAKAFWKADVQEVLQRFGIGLGDSAQMLLRTLYPRVEETSMLGRVTDTGVKRDAMDAFMKLKGDRDKAEFMLTQLGKGIKRFWEQTPEQKRIDFLDRYKTGQRQETPELDDLAKLYSKLDDSMYHAVQQYKPSLNQLDNHFRLFWEVIPGSTQQPKQGGFQKYFSRRPLQGTRGMLKKHTLATASEGIQKGGVLVSTNPQTLFELGQSDSLKFVTAQKMWDTLKDIGHREWVKDGDKRPEGFDWLPDNIAETYFPAKVRYQEDGKEFTKPVHVGRWAVEKNSLRILSNFLSRDFIRESSIGSFMMLTKNAATAFELSLSPFHAVFETIEAMGSQLGVGAMRLWNQGIRMRDGKAVFSGLKDVFSSPLAPYLLAREGGNMIAFASSHARENGNGLNLPEPQYPKLATKMLSARQMAEETRSQKYLAKHPDAARLLDELFQGGAQLEMSRDYETQTLKTVREAWAQGNPFGAFIRAFPAMAHQIMKPLFGVYIPRLKVGYFLKQYAQQIEERQADLDSGRITRAELARRVWQSTENRFGEMNFDNVMWNRTLKSTLQFAFRSVTWKMGNVSLFAGAAAGQAKDVLEWIHAIEPYNPASGGGSGSGKPPGGGTGAPGAAGGSQGKGAWEKSVPHLDMNMAWVIGVAAMTALLAYVWTMVHTGQSPWQWAKEDDDTDTTFGQSMMLYRELTNPRNGDFDYNGKPMRSSMPTYWRDMEKAESSPKRYITGSLSSTLGRTIDVMENSDYRGNYVYDPNASLARQFIDIAGYVAPKPFSISNFQRVSEAGSGEGAKLGGAFGFTKAPSDTDFTKAESRLDAVLKSKEGRKTPEEIEAGKEERQRVESGELGGKALRRALINENTPLVVRLFKSSEIDYATARDIYENYATPDEQLQLRPYLLKKRAAALRRDPERVTEAEE